MGRENSKRIIIFLGILLPSLLPCASNAADSDAQLQQQRLLFEQAERAISRGRVSQYRRLKQKLTDYPLLPYLEYATLKRNLHRHKAEDIKAFLIKYADTPLATRLLQRWLRVLARQGQWQLLVDNYFHNDSKVLDCKFAYALYQTGQSERANIVTEDLWLSGRSLPRSCDAPIKRLRKAGRLSNELIWKRIRLSMQAGNVRLTRYLAEMLPKTERFWVSIYSKVRRDPEFLLQVSKHFKDTNPDVLRWIAVYGLRKLASKDPLKAAEYWRLLQQQFPFTNGEQGRIERRLVLALAQDGGEEATNWLRELKLSRFSGDVIDAYILSAVRDEDWETALEWLNRLEPEEQHTERWRYWRGRVLEALGRLEESRTVYLLNADSRGYYSFLAADRIGNDYRFSHRPLVFSPNALDSLKTLPAILRAGELYALKRIADARREWNYAITRMNKAQLLKAAKLADEWGWHDRAIITLAQARYWDDLELRFPLAYQKLILSQAEKQKINPAWAFAVIRQESAFTSDARSHAGALGLMQLLPRTARSMARSLRIPMRGRKAILNINTNVKLGVRYLRKIQDRYNGHPVLATAAYNAGPRSVKRWLPEYETLPADLWIELVPFKETRKYMKRVLTYTVIYEQRLGQAPVPLLKRMSPIPAANPVPKISVHTQETDREDPRRS